MKPRAHCFHSQPDPRCLDEREPVTNARTGITEGRAAAGVCCRCGAVYEPRRYRGRVWFLLFGPPDEDRCPVQVDRRHPGYYILDPGCRIIPEKPWPAPPPPKKAGR